MPDIYRIWYRKWKKTKNDFRTKFSRNKRCSKQISPSALGPNRNNKLLVFLETLKELQK